MRPFLSVASLSTFSPCHSPVSLKLLLERQIMVTLICYAFITQHSMYSPPTHRIIFFLINHISQSHWTSYTNFISLPIHNLIFHKGSFSYAPWNKSWKPEQNFISFYFWRALSTRRHSKTSLRHSVIYYLSPYRSHPGLCSICTFTTFSIRMHCVYIEPSSIDFQYTTPARVYLHF